MAVKNSNYETTITIDKFSGIFQGGAVNTNMRYAEYSENCDTRDGVLRHAETDTRVYQEAVPAAVDTFAILNRRFEREIWADSEDVLLVVADGTLYARPEAAVVLADWTAIYGGFEKSVFDHIPYEVNSYFVLNGKRVAPGTEGAEEVVADNPIDVLLMTNAVDGMFIVYGDTLDVLAYEINPSGVAPKKFGVITRHAERIWGAAISDNPDMLMYSTPYEPLNWNQNDEYPEDGAGDIQQPSWDGDYFTALRTYGSYLLAFKRNRVWRVSGTNPAEYYFKEQFGGGAIAENTVVVHNDLVFMLSYDGLMVYDGSTVRSFKQEYVRNIIDEALATGHIEVATAAMNGDTYCLALPGGHTNEGRWFNTAVLEYNTVEGTFNYRPGVYVGAFCEHNGKLWYANGRYIEEPVPPIGYPGGAGEVRAWGAIFQYGGSKSGVATGLPVGTGAAAAAVSEENTASVASSVVPDLETSDYDSSSGSDSLIPDLEPPDGGGSGGDPFIPDIEPPDGGGSGGDSYPAISIPNMLYRSAWQDLGAMNATKSGFEVYVQTNIAARVRVRISTEKKSKYKTIRTVANKTKRVRLNVSGRKFQLEILAGRETSSSDALQLIFPAGITLKCELDWD